MYSTERFKTPVVFVGTVAVAILLLYVTPVRFVSADLGNTILTISTFLFGIIAGFFIVVTTTDYNSLKGLIAAETSWLISLHRTMRMYDDDAAERLAEATDVYIQRAFDTELMNVAEYTRSDFDRVVATVWEVPIVPDRGEILQQLLTETDSLTAARQNEVVLSTRTVSAFQWFVLIVLAVLPVVTIYGLRTGELFFDVVTIAFSSMLVLILSMIHSIDLYVWNEETFSFTAYQEVLKSIGRLPYYPRESLEKGRVRPREPAYRVGTLVAGSRERKIEIVRGNV